MARGRARDGGSTYIGFKNSSQLANITTTSDVAISGSTFTIDLENQVTGNYVIESEDATAKTIAFDNVNASASLITVAVLLISTTACAITYPSSVSFAGGEPTFADGERAQERSSAPNQGMHPPALTRLGSEHTDAP